LNSNGTLDTTFNAGAGPLHEYGNGTTEPTLLDNVTLQPDGKIVLNGGFNLFHGKRLPGLVRLKPNGALDDSFAPGSFSLDGAIYAVAVAPDGGVLVSGSFTSFAGFPCSGLVRLKNDFDVLVHSLSRLDVNRVQVTGLAQAGRSYTLQSSEDLSNWTDRDTRTAIGSTWMLEDQTSANVPNRFYRVLRK
jgi:hypothetical protein